MIDSLLHPETLTVLAVAETGLDEDGVPTETTTESAWGPCNVHQTSTTEIRDGREIITNRLRASGPLAERITGGDRIRYGGNVYRIDGEPSHLKGGALNHTELFLIEWKGE